MTQPFKHRLYALLHHLHPHDGAARAFQVGISSLIIANAIAVMLETVNGLFARYGWAVTAFEQLSVALFSLEYLARLWVADLTPAFQRPVSGRIRYALTPMALIDLAAIIPSLLAMAGLDLRMLRVLRLLRLLKLSRHSQSLHRITNAIITRAGDIGIAALFMLLLMLISSTLIYYAERDAQPSVFSSIPAAWWWAVSTLATIGYGDIYPVTIAGKAIAASTAVLGIGLFALPGGIIASALIESLNADKSQCCPHCGKEINR